MISLFFHSSATLPIVSHYPFLDILPRYLDGRHDYAGVKEDLQVWWPKLRPGGLLAGEKGGGDFSKGKIRSQHSVAIRLYNALNYTAV